MSVRPETCADSREEVKHINPFHVVIPARFASTRLPGKVLLPLGGRPMIQWVHERALGAKPRDVIIATDDARIAAAAARFGAEVAMTAATHTSGTDRIAQTARERAWVDTDIVVNVQADEPLIPSALIEQVARLLESHPAADLATLATAVASAAELLDPNAVKVVLDAQGRALYFSRAPIPWDRDGAAARPQQMTIAGTLRHIGIYAYRVAALRRLTALPPSALELREKLEQLRALEHGLQIQVAQACEVPGPDVNTAEDLLRVSRLIGA
jgi:3-deoxy-manno-octulosonate cytidylyltransferase (CMP-KDO synthetase)